MESIENPLPVEAANPLPVARAEFRLRKPPANRRPKSSATPPAIRGYKWSPNGAGFDCRKFDLIEGKTVEKFVGYLGKKRLAKFRAQASDRDELREIIRAWIEEKRAGKA